MLVLKDFHLICLRIGNMNKLELIVSNPNPTYQKDFKHLVGKRACEHQI